jgi:hypothetical protein
LPRVGILEKNDFSVMARNRNKSILLWLMLALLVMAACLFWLEYLGSEKPQTLKEIPVTAPANRTGSLN